MGKKLGKYLLRFLLIYFGGLALLFTPPVMDGLSDLSRKLTAAVLPSEMGDAHVYVETNLRQFTQTNDLYISFISKEKYAELAERSRMEGREKVVFFPERFKFNIRNAFFSHFLLLLAFILMGPGPLFLRMKQLLLAAGLYFLFSWLRIILITQYEISSSGMPGIELSERWKNVLKYLGRMFDAGGIGIPVVILIWIIASYPFREWRSELFGKGKGGGEQGKS
ncbi:MAG: hypothetical protein R3350_10055 [Saprospiraceae bacterium]|nr:hypothetical protein [Saprospiraceae bacterium]